MILETWCCDRCGETTTQPARAEWLNLYAASLQGTDRAGTSERPADLCGTCAREFVAWYTPSTLQAAPPPAEPKPRKRKSGPSGLADVTCGSLRADGDPEGLTGIVAELEAEQPGAL